MRRTLTIITALFAFSAASALDKTEIDAEAVPESVLETAAITAPGVEFDHISIVTEGELAVYEFTGLDNDGQRIEINVSEDGDLRKIVMEIDAGEAPAVVLAAVDNAAPGFKPAYAEMSVSGGIVVYQFVGVHDGRVIDLEIAEDGSLLVMSEAPQS